jgi:hypothetical protein
MIDPDAVPKDPVEDCLDMGPAPACGEGLRHSLLLRTQRLVRRRRRLRRLGLLVALTACYLAGLLTVRFGTPSPRLNDRPDLGQLAADPEAVAVPPHPVAPVVARLPEPYSAVPAVALEWRAMSSELNQPELFRRAGDRYLEEAGDVQSALRCYRQALAASSENDLTVSVNDNWLLMTLKEAKRKEIRHAPNDG